MTNDKTNTSFSIQQNDEVIQLKISNNQIELNLQMTLPEAMNLVENIQNADWEKRQSIKAGSCLNSNVFWCINEDERISVLIGDDDETWEIAMLMPLNSIDEIKRKIE